MNECLILLWSGRSLSACIEAAPSHHSIHIHFLFIRGKMTWNQARAWNVIMANYYEISMIFHPEHVGFVGRCRRPAALWSWVMESWVYYANVAHLFYPSSTSLSRGLVLNKCTLKYAVRAQHTTFTAYHHQSLFPSMDDGGNASRRRQNETYTI